MGTHPIFESDFDCLTEWVVAGLALDPAKKSRKKKVNANAAGLEIVSENAQNPVKKTENATEAEAENANEVETETEKREDRDATVYEKILYAGLKLLQSHVNHHTEKRHLAKLS